MCAVGGGEGVVKTYAEALAEIVAIGIPAGLVRSDDGDAADYGAPKPSFLLVREGRSGEYDRQEAAYDERMDDMGRHPDRYPRRWARVDTDPIAVREVLGREGDYYHLCNAIAALGWVNWDGGTYRVEVDPSTCPERS